MRRIVLSFVAAVVVVSGLVDRSGVTAQEQFLAGQNVMPVYEGWEKNPDGSFNLVFGYFNRNWEEEIDVPVGPANTVDPGGPDQGQPTHFYPRRNRFLFRIRIPRDFASKELVWTLTTKGKTARTYATLKPDYFIDNIVIMNNNGAGGSGGGGNNINSNVAPVLRIQGEKTRSVKVGETETLTAIGSDDGVPKRRVIPLFRRPFATPGSELPRNFVPAQIGSRCCADSASGLRLAWFVYRGKAANVGFDPEQIAVWEDYRDGRNSPFSAGWEPPPVPQDGKYVARATFREAGTYVLRAQLHDGGLSASEDVTFVVTR